jgi:hypothetical protein
LRIFVKGVQKGEIAGRRRRRRRRRIRRRGIGGVGITYEPVFGQKMQDLTQENMCRGEREIQRNIHILSNKQIIEG